MALNYSKSRQIAGRYAAASYALAKEQSQEDATHKSLIKLADVISEHAPLHVLLTNPVIQRSTKQSVFNNVMDMLEFSSVARDTVTAILHNNRGEMLPVIAELYRKKYDDERGVIRVQITSARPLTESQLSQIESTLSDQQQIRLTTHINESLIGGVIVQYGSRMLDASIAGRLDRLAVQLKQAQVAS